MGKLIPMKQKNATMMSALERLQPQLQRALPKGMEAERLNRIVATEVRKNPKLLDCTPASFFGAVMTSAQLGLEPGSHLGQSWVLPYGKTAQLILGYRGLLSLAYRSGMVKAVSAELVFEADVFTFEKGSTPKIHHVPERGNVRGEIVAAYAIIQLVTGGQLWDVMERWELDEHRSRYSKASKGGPWDTHYGEMARKTVLRRALKLAPASVEQTDMGRAIVLDEKADAGVPQELEVEGELVEGDDDSAS